MRSTLVAALAAIVSIPAAAPPASASASVVLRCALSPVGATCVVNGVVNGTTIVNGTENLSYSESIGLCQSTATGTASGAFAVSFVWTRIGSGGVITTTGDISGFGVMAFASPCPVSTDTAVVYLVGI